MTIILGDAGVLDLWISHDTVRLEANHTPMCVSLILTPAQARELAGKLVSAAQEAEAEPEW